MMDSIKTQLWNLITEPDNKTLCPIRVAGIIALIEWLVKAAMAGTFDPVAFGTGFGALVAGVGVALGIKTNSPIN